MTGHPKAGYGSYVNHSAQRAQGARRILLPALMMNVLTQRNLHYPMVIASIA